MGGRDARSGMSFCGVTHPGKSKLWWNMTSQQWRVLIVGSCVSDVWCRDEEEAS